MTSDLEEYTNVEEVEEQSELAKKIDKRLHDLRNTQKTTGRDVAYVLRLMREEYLDEVDGIWEHLENLDLPEESLGDQAKSLILKLAALADTIALKAGFFVQKDGRYELSETCPPEIREAQQQIGEETREWMEAYAAAEARAAAQEEEGEDEEGEPDEDADEDADSTGPLLVVEPAAVTAEEKPEAPRLAVVAPVVALRSDSAEESAERPGGES